MVRSACMRGDAGGESGKVEIESDCSSCRIVHYFYDARAHKSKQREN